MLQITPFLVAAVTALAIENAIFARALGLDKDVMFLKSPKMGILYGGLFTWMVTLSSILSALVNSQLFDSQLFDSYYRRFFRAPLILLCVCVVYVMTYALVKKVRPQNAVEIRRMLPVTTFNTALFGALYLSIVQSADTAKITGYSLGTGVGYTLAILVIYSARKRLAVSPVPRSFRGLPVLLIYIGLLSLAIYGLVGHELPM